MDNVYESSDIITVYTFNNDSVQEIERQEFDVVERTKLTYGSEDWYQLRHLRNGLIELRKPATDAQYVWVAKNGTLLSPSVDYYVTNNKKYQYFKMQKKQKKPNKRRENKKHKINHPGSRGAHWGRFHGPQGR